MVPRRLILALSLSLALAGCERAEPARPALWEVSGPRGEHGWLFGTIHVLPKKADWRSPAVDRGLNGTNLLVLEIAAIDDDAKTRAAFEALARSPGLPPLWQRVEPARRPALQKLLADNGMDDAQFAEVETWAAALTLAQLANRQADSGNGIDRALVRTLPDVPRAEFEGADVQLRIFDTLPEADQRVMLGEVLAPDQSDADTRAADAWRKGDMAAVDAEGRSGMMADPVIRKALLVDRNRAWTARIDAWLRAGKRPFVAVGAGHMAGSDGLPAMLAARGWKVVRVQ